MEDLHYDVKINLLQALIGYKMDIIHLDGHAVKVVEKEVTKPGSVKIVEGEGMPVMHSFPMRFGKLHLHFEVVFPKSLTNEQMDGLSKLQL